MSTIISGGMGDIGKAIATRLAPEGPVTLLYHTSDATEAERFAQSLPGNGHRTIRCDITDAEEVASVIETVGGNISLCVHAAVSPIVRSGVLTIATQDFRKQFEVTCFGALTLFQAVLPQMKQGSRFIGITSHAAEPGATAPNMAGYVAAKYALRGMLRELSYEVVGRGIGVAAIAPGFVATKLHSDLPEKVFAFLKERQPDQATPEEVAAEVARVAALPVTDMTGRSFSIGDTSSLL